VEHSFPIVGFSFGFVLFRAAEMLPLKLVRPKLETKRQQQISHASTAQAETYEKDRTRRRRRRARRRWETFTATRPLNEIVKRANTEHLGIVSRSLSLYLSLSILLLTQMMPQIARDSPAESSAIPET